MSVTQFNVLLLAAPRTEAEVATFKRCAADFNRPGAHERITASDHVVDSDRSDSKVHEPIDAVIIFPGVRWSGPTWGRNGDFDPQPVIDAAFGILGKSARGESASTSGCVAAFLRASNSGATKSDGDAAQIRRMSSERTNLHLQDFACDSDLDQQLFEWFSRHVPLRSDNGFKSLALHEAIELAKRGQLAHAESAFMLAVARADDVRAFIEYGKFLRMRGRYADACQQFERAVARAQATDDLKHLAMALTEYALVRHALGHHEHAEKLQVRAMQAADDAGDVRARAQSLSGGSRIRKSLGDFTEAMRQARESLDISRSQSDGAGMSAQFTNIGLIYRRTGDLALAQEWIMKALRADEAANREEGIARNLGNLALIHRASGDFELAREALHRSVEINIRLELGEGLANDYATLGQICCDTHDFENARRYHLASLALEEKMGRIEGIARSHNGLGLVLFCESDPQGAVEHFKRAARLFLQAGLNPESARVNAMIRAVEAGRHPVNDLADFVR